MLQLDPPSNAIIVNRSKRVPLVREELATYEEEQETIKKEVALKATLVKEEESKAVVDADVSKTDPILIDDHTKMDGTANGIDLLRKHDLIDVVEASVMSCSLITYVSTFLSYIFPQVNDGVSFL
ncbi:hypothetical protein Hdeb2414_s0001g00016681 [Helianthus debilis subsp. tardiflorus]